MLTLKDSHNSHLALFGLEKLCIVFWGIMGQDCRKNKKYRETGNVDYRENRRERKRERARERERDRETEMR